MFEGVDLKFLASRDQLETFLFDLKGEYEDFKNEHQEELAI